MNIRAFFKNIIDSISTTKGLYNAAKKMYWLYNKSARSSNHTTQINFKYPYPINKISLQVRYNQGADAFILSEVFQQQCYRLPLNDAITHILDLGANAGFTAVYFSKFFPKAKIACVEPMPGNIAILKENLSLNKVNSVVFEAAATIEDGKITMEIGDKDYGNKVHNIPFGKSMGNSTLIVDGLSINTILKKLNWKKIALLKIDIEGYEGILLGTNNNWLAKTDTIIIEIHEGVTIDFLKKIVAPYGLNYIMLQKGNWVLSRKEIF